MKKDEGVEKKRGTIPLLSSLLSLSLFSVIPTHFSIKYRTKRETDKRERNREERERNREEERRIVKKDEGGREEERINTPAFFSIIPISLLCNPHLFLY